MITIGLTGKARAGKSAVAEILRDKHGFAIIGFADTLKSMALAIDPIVPMPHQWGKAAQPGDLAITARLSQIVGWSGWEGAKDNYPEVRRFLQKLGTEGVRNHLGADAWVDAWAKKVDGAYRQGFAGVAVPDVRFENEAMAIRRCGQIWQLVRPGDHGASAAGHVSESGIRQDLVSEVIWNGGTLADLEETVEMIMGDD